MSQHLSATRKMEFRATQNLWRYGKSFFRKTELTPKMSYLVRRKMDTGKECKSALILRTGKAASFITMRARIGGAGLVRGRICPMESREALIRKCFMILELRMTKNSGRSAIQIAIADGFWKSAIPFSCNTSNKRMILLHSFQNKTWISVGDWKESRRRRTTTLMCLLQMFLRKLSRFWNLSQMANLMTTADTQRVSE